MKLFICRHGETIENKLGICQGQTEGTLSENGKVQNKLLAERLKKYQIDAIYTSPLKRAFKTGDEIIKCHKNIELVTDERLSEWNMGVLQGKVFPVNFDITDRVEEKEHILDVRKRVKSFLNDILKSHHNQTVLLVSHGLTIKVLTSLINKLPVENIQNIKLMNNSDFSIYHLNNDTF